MNEPSNVVVENKVNIVDGISISEKEIKAIPFLSEI
jgi:hypothetical protein